jgi:hypothetical protein
MFATLVPGFALLVACGHCCAQTVALSIVRLDCGAPLSPLFPPPASQQEKEQLSTEWTGADELAVDAWDEETADSRVDPSSAKISLDGATLTLTYSRRPFVPDRNKPTPACPSLVKLFFTVSGLPRSHYLLRMQDAQGKVRQLPIDG